VGEQLNWLMLFDLNPFVCYSDFVALINAKPAWFSKKIYFRLEFFFSLNLLIADFYSL